VMDTVKRLQGRSAIVTGGASGIGRAIAALFAEEGARVVVGDINEDALAAAARDPSFADAGVVCTLADVRRMDDAKVLVDTAVTRFGGLDVLVCNAGITSVMPIEKLEEDEWDRVLATNVRGMYTMVKAAVPAMKEKGGSIITLGSEMGIVAVPESPAYNASKGAVIMFTKAIALDLIRYQIRVNALCPGITRTPLLQAEVDNSVDPARTAREQAAWAPIARIADPREIASGALFLASDESSFAVGSCLVLDGGFTAR
jgi:NAD(P)-dependent dehydrogenase (short-subunit alcohol dehydrogenase family)